MVQKESSNGDGGRDGDPVTPQRVDSVDGEDW